MYGADRSVVQALESEEWHPRYWTLACVGTFHLLFAATILTIVPPPVPPPVLNVVDVVTFPDGVATPIQKPLVERQEALPVDLNQASPSELLPVPKTEPDPKLGPKLSDRRSKPQPTEKVELLAPVMSTPTPPQPALNVPKPLSVPVPVPIPPSPAPKQAASPLPTPILAPNPEPITVKASPVSPALVQPQAEPLNISGSKLKLKQAPDLKPLRPLEIATPPVPSPPTVSVTAPAVRPSLPKAVPTPTLSPNLDAPAQAARPTKTPLSPPPLFVAPKTAPLTISRAQAPLPKVQVPRIAATDLRLPEVQAASEVAAPAAAPSGVTSVSGGLARNTGQSGAPAAASRSNGAIPGSPSGPGSQSGSSGSGVPGSNNPNSEGGGGASGPTGILPRRPGGASVRQPFPTGDSNTIIGRMDKTYDCSRLNRERDARCPTWDPIEGRNAQGAAGFAVPAPTGLPKLRNPIGTNPLPVCPPGTPGSQMGLSCLPSREGPGIPKP